MNRQLLIRAVQAVTFLFAAFSGFLKGIAPPEGETSVFAIGTASLLTMCIFLGLSGRSNKTIARERALRWAGGVLTAIAALAALFYFQSLERLTFRYPPGTGEAKYIAGTELTPDAAKLIAANGFTSPVVVAKFGGPEFKELVWTKESIQRSRTILISIYLFFVLSIAGAIFAFMESQTTGVGGRLSGRGSGKRAGVSSADAARFTDLSTHKRQ